MALKSPAHLGNCFKTGCKQLLEDHLPQAQRTFENILHLSQGTPIENAVAHNHALCLEMQGEFEQALGRYTDISNRQPLYIKAMLGAANCLSYLCDDANACKLLRIAVMRDPDCVQAYILLSQLSALNNASDYNYQAIQYHQQALDKIDKAQSSHTRFYARCYHEDCSGSPRHMFFCDSLLDQDVQPPQVLATCPLPTSKILVAMLVNGPYADMCRNTLQSMRQNCPALLSSVLVCCLDSQAQKALDLEGVATCLCDGIIEEKVVSLYGTRDFNKLTTIKFMLIQALLQRDRKVLFCDSDIVLLRDPLPHLQEMCERQPVELLAQTDTQDDQGGTILCSGFMFVLPTALNKHLFQWQRVPPLSTSEQPVVNYLVEKFHVPHANLDPALFPSGRKWYADCQTLDPVMVHYNWIQNTDKQKRMRRHGHWFSSAPETMTASDASVA